MQRILAIVLLIVALGYLLMRLPGVARKKGNKGGCCSGGCGCSGSPQEPLA